MGFVEYNDVVINEFLLIYKLFLKYDNCVDIMV